MTYVLIVIIAALLAAGLTPLTIYLAQKWGFVDDPKRVHPAILHTRPIPRAGGIPTLIALVITFLLFNSPDRHILGIFVASVIIVLVGVLDDKFDLNPYSRLATNFLAALLVVAAGVGITWITNPLGGQIRFDQIVVNFDLFGAHSIILLADIFALLWIVWVMNALNWSSGVDGQLSGVVAIATLVTGIVALRYVSTDPSQTPVAMLSFAAAGAYLGFLPYSFYPQKIMPGYGGATLAGFLLAVLSILAGGKLATTLLVLAVPLVDAFWTIIRRLLRGRSPVWGDRQHLHHRLLDLGWTIPQVALFYWSVCAIFGLIALSLDSETKLFALVLGGTGILAILITIALILNKRSPKAN